MSEELSVSADRTGDHEDILNDGTQNEDGQNEDGQNEDTLWLSNAGSLVAGRLVVAIVGWTGTIIIARTLDQDTFGRFTFVFGLLGMMTIATDLGLGRVAISGVLPDAENRDSFAGSYVVLRSLLGLIGYGLAVGFTVVGGYSSEIVQATAIAGAVVIVATASHAYELVLQAHLRMSIIAVSAIVGRLAQLALIVAIVVAGGGFLWLLIPAVVAEVFIAAIKVPRSLRLQSMTYSIQPRLWWTLLQEAVPISIGAALATLYFRVDSIMLSKLDDFTAVGIYGVAFKFIDVLHFVSLSISAPLLTVLVRSWPSRPTAFRTAVDRTVALLALMAGLLIVHFALFAEETVSLLYGSAYSVGATAVQLLVIGQIIAFCSMLGLTILTATANHRLYPYIALAGLAVNVGLNLWAIRR
ncbi:MAG: oligosaccharide flippase family protein, partial [Acidimicrobiales bacterium]